MSVKHFNLVAKDILAKRGTPDQLKTAVAMAKSAENLSPYQENLLLAMIHHEEIYDAVKEVFDKRKSDEKLKAAAKKLENSEPVTEDGPMVVFTTDENNSLMDRLPPEARELLTHPSQAHAAKNQPAPAAKVQNATTAPQKKKNDSTSTSKPK